MSELRDRDILSDDYEQIKSAIKQLCEKFPDEYWRDVNARRAYPEEFVSALQAAGWLSILVPERYGGGGMPIRAGAVVLVQDHRDIWVRLDRGQHHVAQVGFSRVLSGTGRGLQNHRTLQ